jgi:hypothetical protein
MYLDNINLIAHSLKDSLEEDNKVELELKPEFC